MCELCEQLREFHDGASSCQARFSYLKMPNRISPKSQIIRAKPLVTLATESVCLDVTLATESVCLSLRYDVSSCSNEFLLVLRLLHELGGGGGVVGVGVTPILIGVRDVPFSEGTFLAGRKFWGSIL